MERFREEVGDNDYVIWGISNKAKNLINDIPIQKLKYWVDIDKSKWRNFDENIAVYSPNKLLENEDVLIVLMDNYYTNNILKDIKNMGIKNKIVIF